MAIQAQEIEELIRAEFPKAQVTSPIWQVTAIIMLPKS